MSWNGSGTFQINSAGQPVVAGTVISDSVFNALTADLASGLSNCITKDGQQTVTANIPMAGFKFTGMGLGSATTDSVRMDNAMIQDVCECRISAQNSVPVSTSDVTAATFVYIHPYKGTKIALYNGTQWILSSITTASGIPISISATTNTNYDVFALDSGGTVQGNVIAWTNDTTRATALAVQNGVLVNASNTLQRYLGTFRTTTVAGQTEDSRTKRFVWNYYNRVRRAMRVLPGSNWTYDSATIRQANNSTTNQLAYVIGWQEDSVEFSVHGWTSNSTGGARAASFGIGLSSTTTVSGDCICQGTAGIAASPADEIHPLSARLNTMPTLGYQYATWLETSNTTATNTFYYQLGAMTQAGMTGSILA